MCENFQSKRCAGVSAGIGGGVTTFLKGMAAIFATAIMAVGMRCVYFSRFSAADGICRKAGGVCLGRTYYLYSPSSQACVKSEKELALSDMAHLTGESVTYALAEDEEESFIKKILSEYRAEICFEERIGGVLSYYCHSVEIADANGIFLNGNRINLHIAVSEGKIKMGSPIIFGGY